jgi:hypothetical protein
MRKITCYLVIIWVAVWVSSVAHAQILNPVKWSYGDKIINKNEAVLFIKATIDNGWHIYSLYQKDGGPQKTSIVFAPSADYELLGKPVEPPATKEYQKVFSMDVYFFKHSVIFQQRIRLKSPNPVISGKIGFMVCNDQKCLPPDEVAFSIPTK